MTLTCTNNASTATVCKVSARLSRRCGDLLVFGSVCIRIMGSYGGVLGRKAQPLTAEDHYQAISVLG